MAKRYGWTLAALLLAAAAVEARPCGGTPCPAEKEKLPAPKVTRKVTRKTYPLGDIPCTDAKILMQTIVQTCKPKTWHEQGGPGTIQYVPARKALVVCQTSDVHQQVSGVLKAVAALHGSQSAPCVVPAVCSSAEEAAQSPGTPSKPAPEVHKQYGHFVLDNVRVNAMGVSCTIRRIRFLYKGDGIEADVAKCALTNGESEKKTPEVPKAVTDLLEKLEKAEGPKSNKSGCAAGSGCATATCTNGAPACCPLSMVPPPVPESKSAKGESKPSGTDEVEKGKAKDR